MSRVSINSPLSPYHPARAQLSPVPIFESTGAGYCSYNNGVERLS